MKSTLYTMSSNWKKIKASGHFKRKTKKNYLKILGTSADGEKNQDTANQLPDVIENTVPSDAQLRVNYISNRNSHPLKTDNSEFSPSLQQNLPQCDELSSLPNEEIKNEQLYTELQKWAVSFNIKQNALKDLMHILNRRLPNVLLLLISGF